MSNLTETPVVESAWLYGCYTFIAAAGLAGNAMVIGVSWLRSGLARYRTVNLGITALSVTCMVQCIVVLVNYILIAKFLVKPDSSAGNMICKTLTTYPFPDALSVFSVFILVILVLDGRQFILESRSRVLTTALRSKGASAVLLLTLALAVAFSSSFGLGYGKDNATVGTFCKKIYSRPVSTVLNIVQFLVRQGIPMVLVLSSFIRIRIRMVRLSRALTKEGKTCEEMEGLMLQKNKALEGSATMLTLRFLVIPLFLLQVPSQLMALAHTSFSLQRVAWNTATFQAVLVLKFSYCAIMPGLLLLTSARFRSHLWMVIFPQKRRHADATLLGETTAKEVEIVANATRDHERNSLHVEQII